jgi:hypothetical protein
MKGDERVESKADERVVMLVETMAYLTAEIAAEMSV